MEEQSWLDRCLIVVHRLMVIIAAGMVIFMMIAVSCSVMMRYFLNRPIVWIVEISSYLMLYITFLGTAWLLRRDGHVEIDLFISRLRPKTQRVLKSLTSIGGAVVGFILSWKGFLVAMDYYTRGVTVMGILNTPQFLLMAIIPIGGFLLLVEFVLKAIRSGTICFKR